MLLPLVLVGRRAVGGAGGNDEKKKKKKIGRWNNLLGRSSGFASLFYGKERGFCAASLGLLPGSGTQWPGFFPATENLRVVLQNACFGSSPRRGMAFADAQMGRHSVRSSILSCLILDSRFLDFCFPIFSFFLRALAI